VTAVTNHHAGGGSGSGADRLSGAQRSLSVLARCGLAGRTGFYVILAAITVRIAVAGGAHGPQADAQGALGLVSRPLVGKVAVAAVALGFVMFGVGRLIGAVEDHSVSGGRRTLTAIQGVFYVVMAYVPAAFLAGHTQTGSQQQQEKTTAKLLTVPGGQVLLVVVGVILVGVCVRQIRGALAREFCDGLDLTGAPPVVRRVAERAGVVGIIARALVFLPIGVFLAVAAFQSDPAHAYGTDGELLAVSSHPWGVAVLVFVAAGLATFAAFSAIETRYRSVISAR
jgi:hypothetical protein